MCLNFRPLRIENAIPSRVSIATFDDVMIVLDTLEAEAHPQRRLARTFVERVAFPFEATVANSKGVLEHEVSGFGVGVGALGNRAVPNAAEFDLEVLWEIGHVVGDSHLLTGGDVDADWESAYSVGDEAPGGDNPTPDQDIVDDIGRAIGIEYQDNEELKSEEKVAQRDRNRWELDPASSDDWEDR